MTARCREGHESAELDYCSVCGAAMPAFGSPVAPSPAADPGGGARPGGSSVSGDPNACPSCGEPRADAAARFCEVCRYDFVARKGGPPPAVSAPHRDPAPSPAAPPAVVPAPTPIAWELVVTVDASLDTEPDPASPCPQGEPAQTFAFDVSEMLVGRRDDRRDIRPEIPVGDPGASRRHAKFVKNADGTVSLQDLASMNGTRFNAADMPPGSRQVLKEGDEVTLGRWTRIRLARKP